MNAEDSQIPVFDLTPADLPMTIVVLDKDENIVDTIEVEGPGVLEIKPYPEEGRPYRVKILRKEKTLRIDQSIIASEGFWR